MDIMLKVSELGVTLSRGELGVLVALLKNLAIHPNDSDPLKRKIIALHDCIKQFEDGVKGIV